VDEWSITILGTDINTESLDRARKGLYGQWAFREDRAKQWRSRFFVPKDKRYELIEEVRNMVTFSRLNLMEADYPSYETNTTLMDLIFCRNVTIYFSEYVTGQIVNRFYDSLVDGGWLVVGHSEHTLGTYRRFQARSFPGAILYQRTGEPTAWPKDWEWLVGPSGRSTQTSQVPQTPRAWPDLQGAATTQSSVPSFPVLTSTESTEQALPVPTAAPDPPPSHRVQEAVPDQAILPASSEDVEDPIERAKELLEYGHSEQARTLLLQQVEETRDRALVYTLLGQACANLGHWDEAEQWCQRAISVNRLALQAYYTLALVFQHQGNLDKAIDAMKKVVYIDRTNVLGHFGLADLYRSSEHLPQALKSLDNARRLLEARAQEELIPESGGVTAGRLRQTVVRQQQQWEAEASQRSVG
jgi:chemotaxis protein methyltransferase CheR